MTLLQTPAPEAITLRIVTVGSQHVFVDADLAALYGVETKRFNEAVKRIQPSSQLMSYSP